MVMLWLDAYCKENPDKNIEGGLLKLTSELYPKRIKAYVAPAKDNKAKAGKAAKK